MNEQMAMEQIAAIWRRENAYTRNAEMLMEEIIKDCNDGKPEHEILIKAIRCIGCGTGNVVFAKQCLAKLKEHENG